MRTDAKQVYQFDRFGNIVNSYPSMCDVARVYGVSSGHISESIKHNKLFKKEYYLSTLPLFTPRNRDWWWLNKAIYKFDKNGALVAKYKNARECAEENGVKLRTVSKSAERESLTQKTFYLSFNKNSDKILQIRKFNL